MKAIKVDSPGKLEVVDVPMPKIVQDDEILVKVRMAGICGSDMHIFNGTSPVAKYPRIIGHEFAGEVVGIGTAVSVLSIGDHVAIDPVMSCGKCYACQAGRPNVCFELQVRGVHIDGGFQEFVVVPATSAHPISKDLAWERAALVEPYSIAAQVLSRAAVKGNDTVFVMGAGPIGLCILQAVKRTGARCVISDIIPERLEFAASMKADVMIDAGREDVRERILAESGGKGLPVIIDSVCTPRSAQDAVDLACNAGRVILLGFDAAPTGISQLSIVAKELDVRGSRLNALRFPEVITWFEKGEVDASLLISGKLPFAEVSVAFARIKTQPRSTVKMLLSFD